MQRLIQKIGMTMLVALLVEVANQIGNPSPIMAQQTGTYEPPSCEGNPRYGRVKCNYNNGDNYVGNLANGVPSGTGVYVYAQSKDRYEGEWRNGRPNGRGVYIFGASNARYEGIFRDGVIVNGKAIFENGDRYEGPFEVVQNIQTKEISSQPSGRGKFFFANGDRYEGEFFAGTIFGRGVLIRTDGTRCEAEYYNDALYGKGSCRYRNGSRYQGELRGGVPHGKGLLVQANGRRFQGEFRDGQPYDPKASPTR